MEGGSYKGLFVLVKILLILSHGESSVERGLSVNKEMEIKNLKEQTLNVGKKTHL